jgi:hypothetical protein
MRTTIANAILLTGTFMSPLAVAQSAGGPANTQKASTEVSTAPAPTGETTKDALDRNEITYSNIWADNDGKTHITKCVLKGLRLAAFAPPAAPYLYGIAPEEIESVVFSVAPLGWYGDWHHAPGPQWVVTLSGQWQVRTTDGSTLLQGPGEFQFNSDQASFSNAPDGHVGHTARQVGSVPNVRMIITLKKMPGQTYTNQACVL